MARDDFYVPQILSVARASNTPAHIVVIASKTKGEKKASASVCLSMCSFICISKVNATNRFQSSSILQCHRWQKGRLVLRMDVFGCIKSIFNSIAMVTTAKRSSYVLGGCCYMTAYK